MALRINTDHIVAINRNIMDFEYAVRGLVPMRALELQKEGREMLFCNIGNPARFETLHSPM